TGNTMPISVYFVDAFSERVFGGNPAAVCPLDDWLADETLQAIAAEHNLSETAYLRRRASSHYDLRWFTPTVEVDLCGHATLAAALVVFDELEPGKSAVIFETRSGPLAVRRADDRLTMDFPSLPAHPCEAPDDMAAGLGSRPQAVMKATDFVAIYESED